MISQKAKLHNRFDFEIYDTETGETEYAKAENIVVNQMYARLCASGSTYFSGIMVGTGTGTLSASRTTLFAYIANKAATLVEAVYDTGTTAHITKSVTFSETEAIGDWTEIGITFSGSTGLVTHAMITDSEGNPIVVNKTNTKIVTVYATVFAELIEVAPGHGYPHYGDKNLVLRKCIDTTIAGQPFTLTTFKTITGDPARISTIGASAEAGFNADAANKRMYTSLLRIGTTVLNYPVRGIILGRPEESIGSVGVPLPGIYSGHNFAGVALGTGDGSNKEFDFPIDYPENQTVYVNGVAKTPGSDYTMRPGQKSTSTLILDMPDVTKFLGVIVDEIVEIPQPVGGESTITSIALKNGTGGTNRVSSINIKLSLDGTTWVDAGGVASAWAQSATLTLNGFAPAKYKYMKVNVNGSNGQCGLSYIRVYATPPAKKHVEFTSAPANGAAVTADFSVNYIPKSSNFVLDLQAEVVFGEGI